MGTSRYRSAVLVALDHSNLEPKNRRSIGFGIVAAIMTAIVGISATGLESEFRVSLTGGAIAVALSVLFFPVIYAAGSLWTVAYDES